LKNFEVSNLATLLLLVIYLAFISLGLPDSLLGVAWPLMQRDLRVPLEAAGLISMFIAGGTIVSSFLSGAVHKRLSTGKVTFISCMMTGLALLGIHFSPSFPWLLLLAVPLGLGAGSVDAALNNYVAAHYKASHMSWLHSLWGFGATLGPIIMSQFIALRDSWRSGYLTIAAIQLSLAVILFAALPLWKRMASGEHREHAIPADGQDAAGDKSGRIKPMKIRGVKYALLTFLFYCGSEGTIGLWGSSFLINIKHISAATAAQWVSLYYGGITVGRVLSGFITMRVDNRTLIRAGLLISLTGLLLLLAPLPDAFSLIGLVLVGLGFAPVFPGMIHETPVRFGKENSQAVIGYQMGFAYIGSTFLPPLLGIAAARTTIGLYPYFVIAYIIVILISTERINALMKKRSVHGK